MTQLPTEDREKARKKHVKSLVVINTGAYELVILDEMRRRN